MNKQSLKIVRTQLRTAFGFSSLCVLLICQIESVAQNTQSAEYRWKDERVDSTIQFLSPQEPYTLRMEFHPTNRDTIFDRNYKDDNCPFSTFSFSLSHLSSTLNIQYLNDSVWFLYGTRVEYANYPFIFKSTNSGINWETIMNCWPSKSDSKMGKYAFHMFNLKDGIWITGLQKRKIAYRISKNGGYSWKRKSLRIKVKRNFPNVQTAFHVQYLEDNTIQISISYHEVSDGQWKMLPSKPIYESTNFGRSFRKAK